MSQNQQATPDLSDAWKLRAILEGTYQGDDGSDPNTVHEPPLEHLKRLVDLTARMWREGEEVSAEYSLHSMFARAIYGKLPEHERAEARAYIEAVDLA